MLVTGTHSVDQRYGSCITVRRIREAAPHEYDPADLMEGPSAAFDRMRSAREQEAQSILATGAKQAQIIQAQADADAAQTYAASFGKDPQFYDFYRAMQSYRLTFLGNGQDKPAATTIVLSPQNDYLKEFSGRSR